MVPKSKLGRGKPLKNQTKEVLHKIYKYFEAEIERDPNSTVTAAQLVSHSTGISMNALKRVLTEYKANINVKKEPNIVKRRCKKNIISDDIDAQAIRRIIHNFYTKNEEFPIMKDLYLILKADIDYQGSLCTLRRHVAKLGFKWMEKLDNNSILIEKHDYRFARIQYLTKIESYRAQGRNIVYTGEAAIESSRLASKPKPDGSSIILKQPAKTKLVILLAGDQQEGMKRNTLFMYDGFKKEMKEEIECKRENSEQYEKWFKFQLIPNLKPASIVVVDGGLQFHNRVWNTTPNCNSKKKEMIDWLTARNVPYSEDMYKSQLYHLILLNKDQHLNYKTDMLLREHGHTVLRIPPHHPDLNPVKNILSSVENYIGKDANLGLDSLMKIAKEKILSIEKDEWRHASMKTEAEENNLKAMDRVIDEITERSFRSLNDTDDSELEDENGSEPESAESD